MKALIAALSAMACLSPLDARAAAPWADAGTMAGARSSHAVTVLSDGSVLVSGGSDGGALAGAERLAAGSWSSTGSLGEARSGHTATLLGGGKVLVAGGYGAAGQLATCEVYDPDTRTWSATGTMTRARSGHTATLLLDGRVLVAGGSAPGLGVYLSSAEIYDPALGTWTATGSMRVHRVWHTATLLLNGRVLVVDGYSGAATFDSTELYDPDSGAWITGPSIDRGSGLQLARRNHTATLLADGRVLVVGDLTSAEGGSADICDLVAGTRRQAWPMAKARGSHVAALLPDGTVLVAGGYNRTDGTDTWLADAEIYTPATNRWRSAGSMSTPRVLAAAAVLPFGVLVTGGSNAGTPVAGAELYDWTSPLGSSCVADAYCQRGYCVDGVCCDTACGGGAAGDCQACSVAAGAAVDGTCGPVPAGFVCRPAAGPCDAAETCAGAAPACPANAPRPDGTACDDGDACTRVDACASGACVGSVPVTCAASDACHLAGVCDPTTGLCSDPAAPDGTSCDDGRSCSGGDRCVSGACAPLDASGCRCASDADCPPADPCELQGICDVPSGACAPRFRADGAACDDGNGCTLADACVSGRCTGADPVVCAPLDGCHDAGSCDPATGACSTPTKADGTLCDDGDACTQMDACQAGACVGASPIACAAKDECHDPGSCDPATGSCSDPARPDGTPCSAGTCRAGICAASEPGGDPPGRGGCGCGSVGDGGALLALLAGAALRRRAPGVARQGADRALDRS